MPQLVPFYFVNEITFTFIILAITVYVLSKYILPRLVPFYFVRERTIINTKVRYFVRERKITNTKVRFFSTTNNGLAPNNGNNLPSTGELFPLAIRENSSKPNNSNEGNSEGNNSNSNNSNHTNNPDNPAVSSPQEVSGNLAHTSNSPRSSEGDGYETDSNRSWLEEGADAMFDAPAEDISEDYLRRFIKETEDVKRNPEKAGIEGDSDEESRQI